MAKTLTASEIVAGVAGTAGVITYTISGDEVSGTTATFKRLAQGQLGSSIATIYTPPSSAIVSEIVLVNTSGSPVSGVRLFQNGTAAANQILGSITIPANGMLVWSGGVFNVFDANGAQQVSFGTLTFLGDATGSGISPITLTLATVNANVGTFGSASKSVTTTVNGKGLVTAIAEQNIQIAESQVTNLTTDLAGKQPTGNYITALTGDGTATGPGSVAFTLATVNSSPGSFGSASTSLSATVNGKGLITALSSQAIAITASQVTNFDTQVRTSRLDQMAAPTADVSMNSHKLTNVTDPVNPQDAATRNYVDTVAAGVRQQHYAQVAKDTNQASLSGLPTVDGVTLTDSQSILLVGQSTLTQNGLWLVHSGAWTRPSWFAAGSDATGSYVFIQQGTVYAGSEWFILGAGPITVDTSNETWQEVTGAFDITVDATLVKTGNQIVRAAITGNVSIPSGSNTATIQPNVVTNAMLAQAATNTLKGNNTGGTANEQDLTTTQVKAMLAIANTDVSGLGTASTKNVGNTVLDPGTGKLEYAWPSAGLVTGTNKIYASTDRGFMYLRSNAGSAMSDTLPALANTTADIGWSITVHNEDSVLVAVLTMNASGGALFRSATGATSATSPVNYGCRQTFVWSGTQWLLNNGNANLLRRTGTIVAGEFPAFADSAGNVVTSSGMSASSITTALAGKQPTGNYITALTGDGTASGPGGGGSAAFTLATVNSNVGTFGDATHIPVVTVNAKGLVTAVTTATVTATGIGAVPTSRQIITTLPLTGGGDMTADRTLAINPASSTAAGSMAAADYNRERAEWNAFADFGVYGNLRSNFEYPTGVSATQVVMTSGSNVVNIPNSAATTPFVVGRDEGKRITVSGAGAGGTMLAGYIGVVNSGSQCTVLASPGGSALNASTTVTAVSPNPGPIVIVTVQWGTDNTAAIASMVTTLNNQTYPAPKVIWGAKSGLADWTGRYGIPALINLTKSPWWEGGGGSHTTDTGDYTKNGGTALCWWGTSSDGGTNFGSMITVAPPASAAATAAFVRSNTNASATVSASAVGSLSVAPANGNMLVATVAVASTGLTITPPAGWNLFASMPVTVSTAEEVWVYWKVASSEPTSWTWTLSSGSFGNVVSVSEYTGVSTSTPTIGQATATSTNTINTPVITTPAANSIVIQSVAIGTGAAGVAVTISNPANTTSESTNGTSILANPQVSSMHAHDTLNQAAAGSTTARTFTASASVGGLAAFTIAMAPASGGSAVTAMKRPTFASMTLDGRNGDQNQALYLLKLVSAHGAQLDDGMFFMDALAQGFWCDISSSPSEAADTTRFDFGRLCFRQLDNATQVVPGTGATPVTTPTTVTALTGGGVLPSSVGIPITVTSTSGFSTTGGYAWVQTVTGQPYLIHYTGITGVVLNACIVSAEDTANAPTTFVNAFIVPAHPSNGGAMKLAGGSGHNTCCGQVRSVQASFGTTWGPAAIECANSDSIDFYTVMMNGGSNVTETNGNRQRRPGIRFNGSNTSQTLASRNMSIRTIDPGGAPGGPQGGISVMGVLNTGAMMAFPSGPHYVDLQQMGNGAPVPTVETGAFLDWNGNGMWRSGPIGSWLAASTAISAAGNVLLAIPIPPQGWQVGTTLRCRLELTKGAVGTTLGVGIRQNSAATTGTGTLIANAAFTGTAIADAGVLEITLSIVGPLGATCAAVAKYELRHNLGTTGLATGAVTAGTITSASASVGDVNVSGAMTTFNSAAPGSGPQFLFLDINTGSTALTVLAGAGWTCLKPANP